MPEEALDGFDHTQYKDEVEERWGAEAYRRSDEWWRGMSEAERREWKEGSTRLIADWRAAAEAPDADPASQDAGALARRHVEWLSGVPGTPQGEGHRDYVLCLADMYVQDERFAKTYGGAASARYVRDALRAYLGNE